MIYLTQTTDTQRVMVPKAVSSDGSFRIIIISTETHVVALDAEVEATAYRNYVDTPIRFETAPDYGAYEYLLEQGGIEIARGVARVGDLWLDEEEYEADTKITQYV